MTKNIAHRGFSGKYPENTLLAFQKAIEAGSDGIEFDVHLTKDGIPVIHHDEMLHRTTNGSGLIGDFTFDELRRLNAFVRSNGIFEIQRIPSLREYFELVKGTKILSNIELKTSVIHYPSIEQKVLEIIDNFNCREDVIVSSFNHYSIAIFKKLAPDVKIGILEESWLINPGDYSRRLGAECYHPDFHSLNQESINNLRTNEIEIYTWTINDEAEMRSAIANGLDGVITNHPDEFSKILQEMKSN
ncbi:MAG: glycerophosphodiester phosphodiesterase [Anaerolineaceae bacterium]|nr:glycerophosphodiester phosphodiesterase [Anaerolineaceae bacterium]